MNWFSSLKQALVSAAAVISFMLFVGLVAANAQTGTTAINGTVVDQQGNSVAGASVTATPANTQTGRTTETDNSGYYQFQTLPPGVYSVRVELTGFRSIVRDNIELLVGTERKLDFKLELGEVSQSILVSEAAPA